VFNPEYVLSIDKYPFKYILTIKLLAIVVMIGFITLLIVKEYITVVDVLVIV
jgi:hypothetical protein